MEQKEVFKRLEPLLAIQLQKQDRLITDPSSVFQEAPAGGHMSEYEEDKKEEMVASD